MKRVLFVFACLCIFFGCNSHNKESHLPSSNGRINAVAVVASNTLWNGAVGDTIREYFAATQVGLPQDEPIFYLHQIPPAVFKDNMRNSRNILIVNVKEGASPHFQIKDTLFATPQKVAIFSGGTPDEIISEIQKNADSLIHIFKAGELKEAQQRFKKSLSTDKTLSEKFGISLLLPSVYKVVSNKDNFLWIERPLKEGNANLFVYTLPYNRILDKDNIVEMIKVRDSIGKRFVPGREIPNRTEPTYMITQDAFTPNVYDTKIAGRKAIEMRGLWAIDGVPIGGPFIYYIIDDKPNHRQIVVDGVVLAPMASKRDYIFELEAIIRSIKFEK